MAWHIICFTCRTVSWENLSRGAIVSFSYWTLPSAFNSDELFPRTQSHFVPLQNERLWRTAWLCLILPRYVFKGHNSYLIRKIEDSNNPLFSYSGSQKWGSKWGVGGKKMPIGQNNMSLVMRKPAFCICKNKDADQLRGNREAHQRLCFRHIDSMIPLLSKSEI